MNNIEDEKLTEALERLDTEFDDLSTLELEKVLDMLRMADDPNFESYVQLIDEEIDNLETKLADLREVVEPLRKVLLREDIDEE